jgi:hypothetical protein
VLDASDNGFFGFEALEVFLAKIAVGGDVRMYR